MSYTAIVAPISVQKHPNADRLSLGTVLGANVIVGLDIQSGDLGVYFPPDGRLSPEFCTAHDLIGTTVDGKRVGGFFDEKRRVKALKLRGVKSEGFWMPLSCLAFTGAKLSDFKSGDEITAVNGVLICEKYITEATRRAMAAGQTRKETRGATKFFPKHFDTMQYRFVKDSIFNLGGVVYITEKLHGTSQRTGFVLDTIELPFWKRAINRLFQQEVFSKRVYQIVNGTRNVILDETKTEGGYYGDNSFRYGVLMPWVANLHKGEMVFYEIVGDMSETTPIMPAVKIGDKDLKKIYGDRMHWRYGCVPGERKVFVYRITMTNEDGVVTELSWPQVQRRCRELGLMPCPTLQVIGIVDELELSNHDWIRERVAIHTEGASVLDPTHIREGCVVRVESAEGNAWCKSKSFTFLTLESETKDSDTVDVEEAA